MNADTLKSRLERINGKGYKAYKDIEGSYQFNGFIVEINHVQGDPFALPSRVTLKKELKETGFPEKLYNNKTREAAFRDYVGRVVHGAIRKYAKGSKGIGKSGVIEVDSGRQQVLDRSSVIVDGGFLAVRILMGLPAAGRRILSGEAETMFFRELPAIAAESLFFRESEYKKIELHIDTVEDTDILRGLLEGRNLVGFIGDGANLPRRSGIDDRPLEGGVPFKSPPEYEVSFDLPHRGRVTGMGIHRGITLVVGGGFHGKSTLLNALEKGIYNHIPGDGRELVVASTRAVKIRAEDGRRVERVDISPFINNLPFGRETRSFSTDNASGSTSQAANIMEAVEMGADLLMMDEDTSATNFMIRDERMQALVKKEKEPITPFIDRAEQLFSEYGISAVIVIGGSGDYFDIADRVIMMNEYAPVDKTAEAKRITRTHVTGRNPEGNAPLSLPVGRYALKNGFKASRGRREVVIQGRGTGVIEFGRESIDLSMVEQITDPAQTRAIGLLLYHFSEKFSDLPIREGVESTLKELIEKGWGVLGRYTYNTGNLALPRAFEIATAINRLRTLTVRIPDS